MHQLDNYVNWSNSQLSKRPNSKHIKDLAIDMNDGIAFLQLIEVLSGHPQIISYEGTLAANLSNINNTLEFMVNNNIYIHHVSPTEIVDGKLNPIMKLLLALAAHFKKEDLHGKKTSLKRVPSVVSMVSSAAASLSEASRNAWNTGENNLRQFRSRRSSYHFPTSSTSLTFPRRSSTPGSTTRLLDNDIPDPPEDLMPFVSLEYVTSELEESRSSEVEDVLEDLAAAKEHLLTLQNLLTLQHHTEDSALQHCADDSALNDDLTITSIADQLILKNVLLENKEQECERLKLLVSDLKDETVKLNGEKNALERRHSQLGKVVLALKGKSFDQESALSNTEIQIENLKDQHAKEICLFEEKLFHRDQTIDKLVKEAESLRRVENKTETEVFVSKPFPYENHYTSKMNSLQLQIYKQRIFREHDNMRTTLKNMTTCFKPDDPIQHTFESLEQSITSLFDIFKWFENKTNSITETKRSMYKQQGSTRCNGNNSHASSQCKPAIVAYYLNKSTTPIVNYTEIRLDSFTLADFKQVLGRRGLFRYFFESNDAEYGTVREELFFDDEIVPSYGNRVVAWVEKTQVDLV